MSKYLISAVALLTALALAKPTMAQDTRLANQYLRSGEYRKAAMTYKKLYGTHPHNYALFNSYISSLLELEDYETAETALKEQIKKYPTRTNNYVTYGNLLEKQEKIEEANKWYRKGIDEMPNDAGVVSNVGNAFSRLGKYELSLEAYKKGEAFLGKEKSPFNTSIAQLYKRLDNVPKMVEYYVMAAAKAPNQLNNYKANFKYWLKEDAELDELKKQLYTLVQEDIENVVYPELLEWVFIEKEDYKSALRQARALDRQLAEDGSRVSKLADIAKNDGDSETALKAYDYIIDKKGTESPHYIYATASKLKLLAKLTMAEPVVDQMMLDSIDSSYETFIEQMGINANTDYVVKQYADFLALNKNDMSKAVTVLEDLVKLSSIDKSTKSMSKISLADYYLMRGEIWEATLLYSQVDKDFEEGYAGELARFKNAMLFYYAGEFAWAQEQFDILESATSKLISNDAIDMSVFIMDNMGLDTTDVPLKLFAEAQLLTVQNKHTEAFSKLNDITVAYPEHALEDDILFQQAEIYQRQKKYTKALDLYSRVYTEFVEEIRADNALMRSAEIYEKDLEDLEKAKELYEKLYLEFSNSTFAIEARKRYRTLRGDDV